MKIDRLIGILTVLLQTEKVTAAALSERFEVSKRTIHRDVEALCKAGIPVVTLQGSSGGIALADGYKLDKTLFTRNELRAVVTGLRGLDSVAQDRKYRDLMDKFSASRDEGRTESPIAIDLSSHYKSALAPKISAIRQAIDASVKITFVYCSSSGERTVVLAPHLLVFQWSDWYVYGYDDDRDAFRTFKLNRLWALERTDRVFTPRSIPEAGPGGGYFTDGIDAVIRFDPQVKYRLVEEYGPDCCEPQADGTLRFSFPFTSKEYLFEWVLRFGDRAELVEPAALRAELRTRLERALKNYSE